MLRINTLLKIIRKNYSQDGTAAEASQPIECPSQDHTPHDQGLGKRQNNLWRGMKGDLAFLGTLARQLSSYCIKLQVNFNNIYNYCNHILFNYFIILELQSLC